MWLRELMMPCNGVDCAAPADGVLFVSLTPSSLTEGKAAHVLLYTGAAFCDQHVPQADFWSLFGQPEWDYFCQLLEGEGYAHPIREMTELRFLRKAELLRR